MAITAPTQVRLDPIVKQQATELFKDLGMDLSTAINIFLRQCLRADGLPFSVKRKDPKLDQLIASAEEELKDPNLKVYKSSAALFSDLRKESGDV